MQASTSSTVSAKKTDANPCLRAVYEATTCTVLKASTLQPAALETFLDSIPHGGQRIAISATFTPERKLSSVAFLRADSQVLILQVEGSKLTGKKKRKFHDVLEAFLKNLAVAAGTFIAYHADALIAALWLDLDIRLPACYSVQQLSKEDDRASLRDTKIVFATFGDKFGRSEYEDLFDDSSRGPSADTALIARAWSALQVSKIFSHDVSVSLPSDIKGISAPTLNVTARTIRECDHMHHLKPRVQKHDVTSVQLNKKGELEVKGARFSTRVRMHGDQQTSRIELGGKTNGPKFLSGSTKKVKGKMSTFKVQENSRSQLLKSGIKSITTIGRESATTCEAQLVDILWQVLQGKPTLISSNPMITAIHQLPTQAVAKPHPATKKLITLGPVTVSLNLAQQRACQGFCLADTTNGPVIKLVHGPPGTGKTTLISAIVQSLSGPGSAIYIIAQSNVGIKNVAEKLAKIGFLGFRLIVSEEFYFEWHEHLYEGVANNMVRLPEIPKTPLDVERMLRGARVVLCTLSMLTNPHLRECGLTSRVLRPTILIVDEASQIPATAYWPALTLYEKTLEKLCFVGDHKQLAPYGSNDVKSLESIFEQKHLVKAAYFLDTQYRMPHPIGQFISANVYDSKLKTIHPIDSLNSLRLVDVQGGETPGGHSTKNEREARCCIKIARQVTGKDWRILTAYDAQRQLIEDMLKAENLPWEDRVFNVDSFQGNEADYIIVSLVRTKFPGFLRDKRRTNVMLTRCKKGMVIVANRQFLMNNRKAKDTLVAKLVVQMTNPFQHMTERDIMNNYRVFV